MRSKRPIDAMTHDDSYKTYETIGSHREFVQTCLRLGYCVASIVPLQVGDAPHYCGRRCSCCDQKKPESVAETNPSAASLTNTNLASS